MSRTKRKIYPPYEKGLFDDSRDKKKWFKPPSKFKKIMKSRRKAKEKQAFRQDKEIIPEFPKTDTWKWN